MNDHIELIRFPNGELKQNCYLFFNKNSRKTLIIDPGSSAEEIKNIIDKNKLIPLGIINTHGHFDHIGAVNHLMGFYQIPFYIDYRDLKIMESSNLYRILFKSNIKIQVPKPTEDIHKLGKFFNIGEYNIEFIHTPGHTMGSTCFKIYNYFFTGDTVLPGGFGSTKLPGGSESMMSESVALLKKLPNDLIVLPGHGRSFRLDDFWQKLNSNLC